MIQSILITGANRGLGLGFTEYYLKKQKHVIATCREPEKAERLKQLSSTYSNLRIVTLDVADPSSIDALSEKLADQRLDMVINNAGICQPQAFSEWTQQHFMDSFNVNVIGPALLSKSLSQQINKGGKLIQISSGRGSLEWNQSPEDELDAYGVTKAGLNMLTRRMAAKLIDREISVISLSPGWVQTDMGGSEAELTVEESISLMAEVIERVSLIDSGKFFSENGAIIPW